jgi:hypothetical protein
VAKLAQRAEQIDERTRILLWNSELLLMEERVA